MVDLVVGSVPRGEDYFGRKNLIDRLWSILESDNVLFVAPQRFGKTGAMYQLLDNPREQFRPLYMNVEDIMSPANFMVELIAVLLRDRHFIRIVSTLWKGSKGFGRFLRNLPSGIDIGGLKVEIREHTDVPKHWSDYGDTVMSLLAGEEPPLLLLIDEFAIMVDSIARRNRDEVEQLLRWFHAARAAPDTRTRFVIGGSINLVSTLDSLGLVDAVDDLYILRLKPWDADTARQYIEAVFASRRIELQPDNIDTILELVGAPISYLLAVVLNAVLDRQRMTHDMVTVEMIKAAFEEDLLGGGTSAVFQHYRSRIDQYYRGKEEGRAAKAILGVLSRSNTPVREDTLYAVFLEACSLPPSRQMEEHFKQVMDKLDNDFYIVTQGGACTFFSRVLQLWWKTHYGFQEV